MYVRYTRTGHHKWSDKEAKTIREYRREGFSYADLKKMFGGSVSSLHNLCTGRTYKDAGGPIAPRGALGKYNKSVIS